MGVSNFVEWIGGECPVNANQLIVAKLRSGEINEPEYAGLYAWEHSELDGKHDIVAYSLA